MINLERDEAIKMLWDNNQAVINILLNLPNNTHSGINSRDIALHKCFRNIEILNELDAVNDE